MSSDKAVIRVIDLSKRYQIYKDPQDRLKQSLYPRIQRMTRQPVKNYFSEFWALKNVSFEVQTGQTVGIVGRNGSGKSTLLQLICGTLTPTTGVIDTHGRIAALLELGSGFNPEFTGRENVYMNAGILGLTRDEIDWRFDAIAAFADIGSFIEQPIKTYSSGMHARLGFAVAINSDPDILIVDETLSVGDEAFQRKCFARIHQIKEQGASILFVSHSAGTVIELCNHAILLDEGQLIMQGNPKYVTSVYQKLIYAPVDKTADIRKNIILGQEDKLEDGTACISANPIAEVDEQPDFDPHLIPKSTMRYESHGAIIEDPHIETKNGKRVNLLIHGQEYVYTYSVKFRKAAENVIFGMLIKTTSGLELGGGASAPSIQDSIMSIGPGACYRVQFRWRCLLTPNTYFMNAGVMGTVNGQHTYVDRLIDAVMFRVKPVEKLYVTSLVNFNITFETYFHNEQL